ncbi:MAG: ABC transporter permease [Oscillospiraceae bacterium]|nr:ABC transporter permease [Oscillospiraceae bacterium]
MKISDLIRLSFDNLKRRKGRTFLTVLGVIIGTCSIIMMVSIGVALDKSFDDMMTGMGDLTMIEVYNWSGNGDVDPITDDVIDSFQALDKVKVATPLYYFNYSSNFTSGSNNKYQAWGNIRGIRREAMELYGYELKEGRFPSSKDKEYTVIVGEQFAYNFQNTRKQWPNNMVDPIPDENGVIPDPFVDVFKDKIYFRATTWDSNTQEEKEVMSEEIKIVGVIKEDASKGYETYNGVIMDMEDVIALEKEYKKANDIRDENKNKKREYEQAIVKVYDIEDVEEVEQYIKDLGYNTYSMTSQRNEMKKMTQMIQLILGGLGSIAMLVSAISIANTMTMAIYERTKEIGVMKVLGCELRDIKNMFLAEAAAIGFLGGMTGLIICYGLSALANMIGSSLMGTGDVALSIIPLWLAVFGVGFSTMVGIVSGYVPAVRAVKITALSAIRHD